MPNRPTADRFRVVPERSPDFAHLTIEGLRRYRLALSSEEERASYWRRILQARLDLIRAAASGVSPVDNLSGLLAEPRGGARMAQLAISPIDDMPPLPDLTTLWMREPDPDDAEHNAQLTRDLATAEAQLSAYRAALHRRLAASTGELIARYREQPQLCLSALPAARSDLGVASR